VDCRGPRRYRRLRGAVSDCGVPRSPSAQLRGEPYLMAPGSGP
jgi:hypothetical protein